MCLNINGHNSTSKDTGIQSKCKPGSFILLLTKTHFRNKEKTLSQSKGLEKDLPIKQTKETGVDIIIYNKLDFQTKVIERYGEEHFILIKGKILQHNILILNI